MACVQVAVEIVQKEQKEAAYVVVHETRATTTVVLVWAREEFDVAAGKQTGTFIIHACV